MRYPDYQAGAWNQDWPEIIFGQAVVDRRNPVFFKRLWATSALTLRESNPDFYASLSHEEYSIVVTDQAVVMLNLHNGNLYVHISASTRSVAERMLAGIETRYPRAVPTEGTVPVSFWSYSPTNGPTRVTRMIDVQSWNALAENYPWETRAQLTEMMTGFKAAHGGQLLLWQGVPGTGKTHALRSLAWEWREWAELHYVIDPDEMFGAHANYLVQVLLEDTGEDDKWKVLVLEDTGEMLAADARTRVGQALSRLLNVVDGLIGQGLRVLVLVTTNEELKSLHPAIQRPGRCAAQIEFKLFSSVDAGLWLTNRAVEGISPHANGMTLAEMFAIAEDFAERPVKRPVGFANV